MNGLPAMKNPERYGAKYENGVAYLLSYTVSVEKMWTQNTKNPDALRIFFPEYFRNHICNLVKP
jgi:hypothetical protein